MYVCLCRCELALLASINIRNCISFYQTAEEIGADTLKDHCSTMITNYWVDLNQAAVISQRRKLLLDFSGRFYKRGFRGDVGAACVQNVQDQVTVSAAQSDGDEPRRRRLLVSRRKRFSGVQFATMY